MSRMKPNPKGLLLQLAGLVLATVIALGLQARERALQSENLYGYTVAAKPGRGTAAASTTSNSATRAARSRWCPAMPGPTPTTARR